MNNGLVGEGCKDEPAARRAQVCAHDDASHKMARRRSTRLRSGALITLTLTQERGADIYTRDSDVRRSDPEEREYEYLKKRFACEAPHSDMRQ